MVARARAWKKGYHWRRRLFCVFLSFLSTSEENCEQRFFVRVGWCALRWECVCFSVPARRCWIFFFILATESMRFPAPLTALRQPYQHPGWTCLCTRFGSLVVLFVSWSDGISGVLFGFFAVFPFFVGSVALLSKYQQWYRLWRDHYVFRIHRGNITAYTEDILVYIRVWVSDYYFFENTNGFHAYW